MPADAVMMLARIGFIFRIDNGKIVINYKGEHNLDRATITPLIDMIRNNKDEVILFLLIHCPQCGGIIFWGDHNGQQFCMNCDPLDYIFLRGLKSDFNNRYGIQAASNEEKDRVKCVDCRYFQKGEGSPEALGYCVSESWNGHKGQWPLRIHSCKHFDCP